MTLLAIPRKTVRLLSRRWKVAYYSATCFYCEMVYAFRTSENEGSADYVDVICSSCNTVLGRVREDYGGDFHLSEKDSYSAN